MTKATVLVLEAPNRLVKRDIEIPSPAYHYVRTLRYFARCRPDRLAVAAPQHQLTVAQLLERAEALAGHLCSRGIAPGTPVCTMASNSAEVIETFYAALIAGAPPTNINPRYTAAEVRYVLEDCRAGAVVFEEGSAAVVAQELAGIDRPMQALQTGSAAWEQAITHDARMARELSETTGCSSTPEAPPVFPAQRNGASPTTTR